MSSDARKRAFHREAAKLLREVAIHPGLRPGAYDIRSNRAGPAVMWNVKNVSRLPFLAALS